MGEDMAAGRSVGRSRSPRASASAAAPSRRPRRCRRAHEVLLIVAGNERRGRGVRLRSAPRVGRASFQTRPEDDWRRALDAAGDDIAPRMPRTAPTVDDDDELGASICNWRDAAARCRAAGAADGPSAFDRLEPTAHVLKQAKQCLETAARQPVRSIRRVRDDAIEQTQSYRRTTSRDG